METITFLKRYSAQVEIVDYMGLSESIRATLPDYWNQALSHTDKQLKIALILTEWRKYPLQLSAVTKHLTTYLQDVELIYDGHDYALLYCIRAEQDDEMIYYQARNPNSKRIPEQLHRLWSSIPASFRQIYEHLHNGWVYFPSQSNGLSAIEDVIILGDLEWGILDEIEEHELPFKLSDCLGVFHNGMGDYAAIDLRNDDPEAGFIWWHTEAPKLNIKIWPVIDEWTCINLED